MTPDDLPPVEGNPEADPNWTPPIVHEPVPVAGRRQTKTVDVTTIPAPNVVNGHIVVPISNGIKYTVNDKVIEGAVPISKATKVKAVAADGFKFAKGLTQTFNLKP